jgi:hypothetical protein
MHKTTTAVSSCPGLPVWGRIVELSPMPLL